MSHGLFEICLTNNCDGLIKKQVCVCMCVRVCVWMNGNQNRRM